MGNCCKSFKLYSKPRKNITLLVLGLDNSGKTTMARRLAGEPVDSVLKTLGFSLVTLRYRSYQISLYDLGGSAQIRDIWSKYFVDAHGIIYMVDSSDLTRLEESKKVFADLLSHENISGKPVLLLANKQDKENALDELEIVDQLDVERVVNRHRCLTRVEICAALMLEKYKIDIGIKRGFRWLVENIIFNYQILNERVQCDMSAFASRVQRDREEWKARLNAKNDADTCEDAIIENGNPFHPINEVIENINGRISLKKPTNKIRNGVAVKNVLIDNYVREASPPPEENDKNIPDFTVKTDSAISQISFTKKRPYSKHKRKFARFNKTAPLSIDALMQDNSSSDLNRRREVSKYSTKSGFAFELDERPKNYLTRRPATAPSKFNFSSVKVNTAWDLSAPLDISVTSSSKTLMVYSGRESSDAKDVVSFF